MLIYGRAESHVAAAERTSRGHVTHLHEDDEESDPLITTYKCVPEPGTTASIPGRDSLWRAQRRDQLRSSRLLHHTHARGHTHPTPPADIRPLPVDTCCNVFFFFDKGDVKPLNCQTFPVGSVFNKPELMNFLQFPQPV